uniref:G-protein coupled receptors family 1 profile domain-containing protein n=1 Tax=Cyclopterus lumpus TaxID=8103 RepID=A0A8C3G0Y5_CYCLU
HGNTTNTIPPFGPGLTLFADYGPLRYLFFSLCLLIYMTIISANVVLILTVCLGSSLHQPMYIFICCLSCNSLYGSAGFFPRFLMDLLSDTHFIFTSVMFSFRYTFFTPMFVAICQPLHYHSKMTFRTVCCFMIFAVLYPAFVVGFVVYLASQLPLRSGSYDDKHLHPVFFILYTYARILLVCRRQSTEFRGKALQTCLPHIVTFLTYSILLFCELSLTRIVAEKMNPIITTVLSLEYLIIPPIINPLVYGLTLPQIKTGIIQLLKKRPAAKP